MAAFAYLSCSGTFQEEEKHSVSVLVCVLKTTCFLRKRNKAFDEKWGENR